MPARRLEWAVAGGFAAWAVARVTAADRLPLAIAPAVASTLLVLNATLAVFKPGWRLRSDR